MKKYFFFLTLISATLFPLTVSGQENSFEDKDYNIVSGGYDLMFDGDDKLSGVNLQIVHGFRLGTIPLYLETGIGLTYNTSKYIVNMNMDAIIKDSPSDIKDLLQSYNNFETKRLNSLTIYIPLHLGYKFMADKFIGIMPYTGFSWNFNAILDYKFDAKRDINYDFINGYNRVSQRTDLNISNFSWDVGLKFFISRFYLGVQYGLDIMPRANIETSEEYKISAPLVNYTINKTETYKTKVTPSNLTISIGYIF